MDRTHGGEKITHFVDLKSNLERYFILLVAFYEEIWKFHVISSIDATLALKLFRVADTPEISRVAC